MREAIFQTLYVDTGPDGDYDPTRPIASIVVDASTPMPELVYPPTNVTVPAIFKDPLQTPFAGKASTLAPDQTSLHTFANDKLHEQVEGASLVGYPLVHFFCISTKRYTFGCHSHWQKVDAEACGRCLGDY